VSWAGFYARVGAHPDGSPPRCSPGRMADLTFNCAQCGGVLDPPVGARFAVCPFCGSSVFFDRSRAVLHFVAERTLDEPAARARLLAWMAGNETVKNLENDAVITASSLTYFPLWRFVSAEGGAERQWSEPARASVAAGIGDVPLSGGGMRHVSAADMTKLKLAEPEVRLESALQWLGARGVAAPAIRETSLVHLPLYEFAYTWRGREWKAAVDGVSGRLLVASYPAKSESAYLAIAALAYVGLFVLGMACPNVFVRFLLFAVAAVPLGVVSLAVVRRV
jgi:hypothetical protein